MLVPVPGLGWRLYLSCATYDSKHWWVDSLTAPTVECCPPVDRQVVLPGDERVAVKDPVIQHPTRTGEEWVMWLCCHPLTEPGHEDRMTTRRLTSPDGLGGPTSGEVLAGRPGHWDARGARVTAVSRPTPSSTTAAPTPSPTGTRPPASRAGTLVSPGPRRHRRPADLLAPLRRRVPLRRRGPSPRRPDPLLRRGRPSRRRPRPRDRRPLIPAGASRTPSEPMTGRHRRRGGSWTRRTPPSSATGTARPGPTTARRAGRRRPPTSTRPRRPGRRAVARVHGDGDLGQPEHRARTAGGRADVRVGGGVVPRRAGPAAARRSRHTWCWRRPTWLGSRRCSRRPRPS